MTDGLVERVETYARRSGVSYGAIVEGLSARARWEHVRTTLHWLRSWRREGLTRAELRRVAAVYVRHARASSPRVVLVTHGGRAFEAAR